MPSPIHKTVTKSEMAAAVRIVIGRWDFVMRSRFGIS
jgi:hypothetical protein